VESIENLYFGRFLPGRSASLMMPKAILEKVRPLFEGIALGAHSNFVSLCAEIADFLNQVLKAHPVRLRADKN
jgi:hypothetical protein